MDGKGRHRARTRDGREFKQQRGQWQRERHLKINIREIVTLLWLSLLPRIYYWQNMLQMDWCKGHWSKYREWKNYCCVPTLSWKACIWKFHVVIWQTTSKNATKCVQHVQHVQHDYLSSFNELKHCFLASPLPLLLPSTLFKLPKDLLSNLWKSNDTRGNLTSSLIFPISHCKDESTSKEVPSSSVLQPPHAYYQGSDQILPECWNLLLPGQWQHTLLERQFLFDHPEKDNIIINYRNWRYFSLHVHPILPMRKRYESVVK